MPSKKVKSKKNFLKLWSRIREDLRGKHICLFLDFDGTLTPIRRHPGHVRLSAGTKQVLRKLSRVKSIDVVIVSGRGLSDIRKLVGVKGIVYVGNHGLEAKGPGLRFVAAGAATSKRTIKSISRKLKTNLTSYKGIVIEDKALTLSVHFRMASSAKLAEVKKLFGNIIAPYKFSRKISITAGKKVWEIRPPIKWDKGRMVAHMISEKKKKIRQRIAPFYIGDDRTDEDVFRVLGKGAYTIKVGKSSAHTHAAFYMRNVTEVRKLLKNILDLRKGEK